MVQLAGGQIQVTLPSTAILAVMLVVVMLVVVMLVVVMLVVPMESCCSPLEEDIMFSWLRPMVGSQLSVEDGIHVTAIHGTLPGVSTLRRAAIFHRFGHFAGRSLSPIATDRQLPTGWDLHQKAQHG
jgi:hypothetical protein